jgi:putative glutamine transport system substrate-binding protein
MKPIIKNIICAISIVAICLTMTGCAKKSHLDAYNTILKRGKIIVGVKYDTPPFGFKNKNGYLSGYDVDLAHLIAQELLGNPNAVEFRQVNASNRILALNSNQVDMIIATMTITPQRRQVVDFSNPYFYSGQAILVPTSSKITSIRQLNNKDVIVVFGSTAEQNLMMFAPDAHIMGYKTYTSGYEALKSGRADAMTSDDTILLGIAMQDSSVKLLPRRYTKEPYGIALKKGVESQSLLNKINFILADLTSSGQLRNLKYKWIKY